MSRLIDADALKSLIAGMAIYNNYPANKANALCELIDAQPTAYDVGKVVEQIKSLSPANYVSKDDVLKIVKGGGVNGKEQS